MTPLPSEKKTEIARRVEKALEPYQPRAYRIAVDPDSISVEDDWYEVLVTTPNHERDRDFYDALTKAEDDLEKSDREMNYLLVPVLS